jgi:RNA polymerase sigma factor (sigma-70 family)
MDKARRSAPDTSVTDIEVPQTRAGSVTRRKRDADLSSLHAEWEACYQAEMPQLIRYLMKCFGESDMRDAADAAQSAFVELFAQWHAVSSPRAWLRTVAFRQMLRRPAGYPLDEHSEAPVLSAPAILEIREQELQVLKALRQLPPAQRQVMALIYDQFTYQEIAEITGKNEVTIRKNVERARSAMKEFLKAPEHRGRTPRGMTTGQEG